MKQRAEKEMLMKRKRQDVEAGKLSKVKTRLQNVWKQNLTILSGVLTLHHLLQEE